MILTSRFPREAACLFAGWRARTCAPMAGNPALNSQFSQRDALRFGGYQDLMINKLDALTWSS